MIYELNLVAGWGGFLAGAISGLLVGRHFHEAGWLGGYDAFPRRMVRLGHIAFFGLGLINILFALSAGGRAPAADWASRFLVAAAAAMPLNCFLTAWRGGFRRLFFIPAGLTTAGIAALLVHLA